jgi:hypothetical protein
MPNSITSGKANLIHSSKSRPLNLAENDTASLGETGILRGNPHPDPNDIRRMWEAIIEPGAVTELRALGYIDRPAPGKKQWSSTLSGYYDNPDAFAQEAVRASLQSTGLYCMLNPIDPAYLARRANRTAIVAQGESTPDSAIAKRRWLPVDIDPRRPSGISAMDDEKALAMARISDVEAFLTETFGFPEPIRADGGNSAHLLYRTDLPNDEESRDLVKACLEAIDILFGDDSVSVDTGNFNAARIWKCYGTPARKGDHTLERPHRLSRILYVPNVIEVVPVDKLQALARTVPKPDDAEPSRAPYRGDTIRFDVEDFMSRHGIEVLFKGSWGQVEKWLLTACPFNADHNDKSAVIIRFPDGRLGFKCHHNSCQGRNWGAVRDLFEPDRPKQASSAPSRVRDDARSQPTPKLEKKLQVTQLSTVQPARTEYLWNPFLPRGRPVALEGDPGVGKSALTCKIISHLTTGRPFPNVLRGTPPPSDFDPVNVCLLTTEDDSGDTIRPRLKANGADCSRVYRIEGWQTPDGDHGQVTMQDLGLLKMALTTYMPALIVFDPFQSYFGKDVDMHRANQTRPVLDAVDHLCRSYNCTPLFIRHIGKSHREAIYAGLGSIDIAGVMRSILLLGQDPENEHRRILAHAKANGGRIGQSIVYQIASVEHDIYLDDGTVTVNAPVLHWVRLSSLKANDLSMPVSDDPQGDKAVVDDAVDFLRELLAPGPMLAKEAESECKSAGYTVATIRRAKAKLGVLTRRQIPESGNWPPGGIRRAPWEWALPLGAQPTLLGAQPLEHVDDEHLVNHEHLVGKSMACEDGPSTEGGNYEHLVGKSTTYEKSSDCERSGKYVYFHNNQLFSRKSLGAHLPEGCEYLVIGQQNQIFSEKSEPAAETVEHLATDQKNQSFRGDNSLDSLDAHLCVREIEHLVNADSAPPQQNTESEAGRALSVGQPALFDADVRCPQCEALAIPQKYCWECSRCGYDWGWAE